MSKLHYDESQFNRFVKDINGYRVLSKEEEHELIIKSRNNDESARNMLIEHNLKYVVTVAKKYIGVSDLEIMDLINEGVIGLNMAIDEFDISKNCKFITYASSWIYKYIKEATIEKGYMICKPAYMHAIKSCIRECENKYLQDFSQYPTTEELYKIVKKKVKSKKIINYDLKWDLFIEIQRDSNTNIMALDQPIGEDDSMSLKDIIADEKYDDQFNEINNELGIQYLIGIINDRIGTVKNRKRFISILIDFYGLGDNKKLVGKEIGIKNNINNRRVSAIINKILADLRHELELGMEKYDGDIIEAIYSKAQECNIKPIEYTKKKRGQL